MTRTPDHTHLAALLACVQLGLRQEIANQLAGHPRAQHFDGDKTTGGGGSDPTATAATTPDKARHDLEAHDAAIDRAYRALLTLAALSDKYLPSTEPRRATMQADTRTCHIHDRAGANTNHHHGKHRTDLGSYITPPPFKEPVYVCAPCYEHIRRLAAAAPDGNGRLPTDDELVRHDLRGVWSMRTTGKRATVFTARQIADEWTGAA